MRILRSIPELSSVPGPVFLAIGVLDGVHLGHAAVLARALADAAVAGGSAVAVTFEPHPLRVTRPGDAPRLLTSLTHKIALLERLGVETLLVIPFTPELAATSAEDFVAALAGACRPLREICVGHAWAFGRGRGGNLELLRRMGDRLGFEEVGIPAVTVEGELVSSTRIRACVEAGELAQASRLLGRPFSLLGTVEHGEQMGRKLGFPTANLTTHSEQFPPNGVYAVRAAVQGEFEQRQSGKNSPTSQQAEFLPGKGENGGKKISSTPVAIPGHVGQLLPGVLSIGTRPTLHPAEDAGRTVELHVLDFQADLYGQEIEVFFQQFLRKEERFPSLEALKEQIARDVEQARRVLR